MENKNIEFFIQNEEIKKYISDISSISMEEIEAIIKESKSSGRISYEHHLYLMKAEEMLNKIFRFKGQV